MLPPFCSFPLLHDSFSLTVWDQENSPSQRGGGTDHGSVMSAQEGGRWSSPPSYFSFDYKAELLPGKSHGWRSLVGCSPWGCWELDMTQWLHFHFSLSCIGEGNGNPRQCSCLENHRDGGAWWAAVYEVAQSWTRLKQLSSSILILVLN